MGGGGGGGGRGEEEKRRKEKINNTKERLPGGNCFCVFVLFLRKSKNKNKKQKLTKTNKHQNKTKTNPISVSVWVGVWVCGGCLGKVQHCYQENNSPATAGKRIWGKGKGRVEREEIARFLPALSSQGDVAARQSALHVQSEQASLSTTEVTRHQCSVSSGWQDCKIFE